MTTRRARSEPVVSIVLPTHRPNPHFAATLASVAAQTWTGWELIVVDDGWDDPALLARTVDIGSAVRVVRQPPGGIARARNAGLAESTGELVAFLDHDDVWHANHLQTLVPALLADDAAVGAYAMLDTIDEDGLLVRAARPSGPATYDDIIGGGDIRPGIGNMLVRRAVISRIGGFQRILEPADDLDVIYKLAAEGRFVYCPVRTCAWRRHDSNTSNDLVACAEAADRMFAVHESAARVRGDLRSAELFARNRQHFRDYWVSMALAEAVRGVRGRDRAEASRLLRWALRFSPRWAATHLFARARRLGRAAPATVARADEPG